MNQQNKEQKKEQINKLTEEDIVKLKDALNIIDPMIGFNTNPLQDIWDDYVQRKNKSEQTNTKRLFLPKLGYIYPTTTSGGTEGIYEMAAQNDIPYIELDKGVSNNYAMAFCQLPYDYEGGAIKVRLYWTSPTGAGNDAGIYVAGKVVGANESLSSSFTDEGVLTCYLTSNNELEVSGWRTLDNINGTPAAGKTLLIRVWRGTSGALPDTFYLLGIEINYN